MVFDVRPHAALEVVMILLLTIYAGFLDDTCTSVRV
jgi:hypothetical protein